MSGSHAIIRGHQETAESGNAARAHVPHMASILYVWLPCKKVYPLGPATLADAVHRQHPRIRQRILDLSLIPRRQQANVLRAEVRSIQPDLVCFSWRDIQIYSPHEGDDSLEYAFRFFYARNPFKRVVASLKGLAFVYAYYRGIRSNLSLLWTIHREYPAIRMMIGGGAFSAFADQLIEKLPEGVIGILGEGEDAVMKLIEGQSLDETSGERVVVRRGGKTLKGSKPIPASIQAAAIDVSYIRSIFPQSPAYHGTSATIGVQTKRGCPYDCQFCLYPYLEGRRVRYRPAEDVVAEISQYYHQWGVRRFWFTDAQFITGHEAYPQCIEILERIIAEQLSIEWSGYIRTSLISRDLAKLMVASGVGDLEVAITSGSQAVLNGLKMGFRLDALYQGCRYLKEAGYRGKIILNFSLNAPGETEQTLRESVEGYKTVVGILGERQVYPMLFFLGIQPNTGLEKRLLEEGYLSHGYNPLHMTPRNIKKLLYNPAPFNKVIARACLGAWDKTRNRQSQPSTTHYADANLSSGLEAKSGRDVLLALDEVLRPQRARN